MTSKCSDLLALEFVGAVAGADRRGERVAAGALHEFHRFVRIRQAGVPFVDFDVFFHAAEHSQLRLHADAFGVGAIDDALA